MMFAIPLFVSSLVSSTVAPLVSEPPSGEATSATEPSPAPARAKEAWIRRYRPRPRLVEIGSFGGIYVPAADHELFEADRALVDQGFAPLARLAPTLGIRVGALPLAVLGVEVEGAVMPTQTEAGQSALLWTARGGLVGQLPWWSVVPFVTVGAGVIGVRSDRDALGDDIDPAIYFGGGAKLGLGRWSQLRIDVRDVVSHQREVDATLQNHTLEVLLSFVVVLGRPAPPLPSPAPPPPPPDGDRDGFLDHRDACPDQAGVLPNGCPVADRDDDGFFDDDDGCPDEAGVSPDGCPARDGDGDGVLDVDDACPTEAGEAGETGDGCPRRDLDGDGMLDDDDGCVAQAETVNGYEDADGCPDEVPEEVVGITGVVRGIEFVPGKALLRKRSFAVLNRAAEVLARHPSVRIGISGHTDDRGDGDGNVELSRARAGKVREYLVGKGIEEARILIRGAGSTEPIAPKGTKAGRTKNRRIEFELLLP